jgi:hypothetical protein
MRMASMISNDKQYSNLQSPDLYTLLLHSHVLQTFARRILHMGIKFMPYVIQDVIFKLQTWYNVMILPPQRITNMLIMVNSQMEGFTSIYSIPQAYEFALRNWSVIKVRSKFCYDGTNIGTRSTGPNWVGSTWRQRQNTVPKRCVVFTEKQADGYVHKHTEAWNRVFLERENPI